jgi:hypothetical protein
MVAKWQFYIEAMGCQRSSTDPHFRVHHVNGGLETLRFAKVANQLYAEVSADKALTRWRK